MKKGYRDLIAWQKGRSLCVAIYHITDAFPVNERFGLSNQLRRAAVSIPSNIAEGSKRKSSRDQKYFYTMAYGSGAEIETQLDIAQEIFPQTRADIATVLPLPDGVMRLLHRLSN